MFCDPWCTNLCLSSSTGVAGGVDNPRAGFLGRAAVLGIPAL